ncbi:hypothetical protein SELR_16510 [Selenomonas ruminantium subsp. lactilytica TAM6421]|uniref:Uncharacterized protein n=1 Tax=Selenomonas ruminantium subsp. lactilytica (strain NBRC 103574 / TAM6421) TaxID=927704 RepID=I0GRH2_SELRL|nr:hypothetical protein SELR_16510 [Selenomonas ruminantium subsp. lactilytica TAM6421]
MELRREFFLGHRLAGAEYYTDRKKEDITRRAGLPALL